MITTATQYRYVSEAVWLPTYFSIAALILSGIENSSIATIAIFGALVGSRIILELVYRVALGDARLQWQVGLVAFASQIVVWGLFWLLHTQKGPA